MIDADIAYLTKNYSKPFRLMIEVWPEAPVQTIPSTPQPVPYSDPNSTYRGILPDYILKGVSGNGIDAFAMDYGGYVAALWRPAVMDRYIALINYLGAKYDSNPYVELISAIPETGVAVLKTAAATDPTYSWSNFFAQLQRLAQAMTVSWPTTNRLIETNYASTGGGSSDMSAFIKFAYQKGLALGENDILYNNGSSGYETASEQIVRGAYVGLAPLIYQETSDWAIWQWETATGVEAYCYGSLKCTHLAWGNHHNYGTPAQNWSTGVVPALQAVKFRINSACPSSYANRCNTK
jgi:hypothetical protein